RIEPLCDSERPWWKRRREVVARESIRLQREKPRQTWRFHTGIDVAASARERDRRAEIRLAVPHRPRRQRHEIWRRARTHCIERAHVRGADNRGDGEQCSGYDPVSTSARSELRESQTD